jgi:AcrR family transcriptional regulator
LTIWRQLVNLVQVTPRPSDDARRRKLLDAALGVFLRYGFRKTSMDEVARAAQLSRQGLYLHFATKEDLFRATLENALEGSLALAVAALEDQGATLEDRLVRAFDAWVGRYVGMLGTAAADLSEASGTLGAGIVESYDDKFLAAVAKTIRRSTIMPVYRASGLAAPKLADTLHAAARGLKYSSPTREAFVESMRTAVRVMCAPARRPA